MTPGRVRDDENLPEAGRLDELGQTAAGVALHVEPVLRLRRLDVGQIGRVELPVESNGEVGRAQRLLHFVEELNPARQVAQRQGVAMGSWSGAISPCFAVLRPIHLGQQRRNHVVDVDEFDCRSGSEISIGSSWAILWQNVATTEL